MEAEHRDFNSSINSQINSTFELRRSERIASRHGFVSPNTLRTTTTDDSTIMIRRSKRIAAKKRRPDSPMRAPATRITRVFSKNSYRKNPRAVHSIPVELQSSPNISHLSVPIRQASSSPLQNQPAYPNIKPNKNQAWNSGCQIL